MTPPERDAVVDETLAMRDAAGITVTDAAGARAKLREMDERMTPQVWERLCAMWNRRTGQPCS